MKKSLFLITIALGIACGENALAQDAAKSESATEPKGAPAQNSPTKPKLTQEQLEANFKATLTNATLKGRWCSIKNGALGPEQEDKYNILSITKIGGEVWLVKARIQYGKNDFVAPIPVQVKWAGDTPVITLDKTGVPGSGEYSARVMIYEKTYAGTWSGGGHAGLLNGLILPGKE